MCYLLVGAITPDGKQVPIEPPAIIECQFGAHTIVMGNSYFSAPQGSLADKIFALERIWEAYKAHAGARPWQLLLLEALLHFHKMRQNVDTSSFSPPRNPTSAPGPSATTASTAGQEKVTLPKGLKMVLHPLRVATPEEKSRINTLFEEYKETGEGPRTKANKDLKSRIIWKDAVFSNPQSALTKLLKVRENEKVEIQVMHFLYGSEDGKMDEREEDEEDTIHVAGSNIDPRLLNA